MADLYNGIVDTEWVDASTLATFTSDNDYFIQNQGLSEVQVYVGTDTPTDTTREGTIIPVMYQAHFKKGTSDIYIRAKLGTARINISEAE